MVRTPFGRLINIVLIHFSNTLFWNVLFIIIIIIPKISSFHFRHCYLHNVHSIELFWGNLILFIQRTRIKTTTNSKSIWKSFVGQFWVNKKTDKFLSRTVSIIVMKNSANFWISVYIEIRSRKILTWEIDEWNNFNELNAFSVNWQLHVVSLSLTMEN